MLNELTAETAFTLNCSPGLVEEYLRIDREVEGRAAWTPEDNDMRIVTQPAERQLAATDGHEYVLVYDKGPAMSDRVKRRNICRDFHVIRAEAGLPKCSFHDLRTSYCTNLAGAVPLNERQ
jgi:integrase